MKPSSLLLAGLAAILLLPAACTTKKVERRKPTETLRPGTGPAATNRPVTKPTPPAVAANEAK